MKNLLILMTVFCIIPVNSLYAQSDPDEEAREKLAMTFFKLVKLGKTKSLPALFHFPPTDSQNQVKKDTKYIVGAIDAFLKEFGDISNKKLVTYQKQSQDFRIHTGTIDYWQSHLDFERQTYSVNFSKAGEGYILLDMCNISSKWQIGFLRFALPQDNAKAGDMFAKIGPALWELKQE